MPLEYPTRQFNFLQIDKFKFKLPRISIINGFMFVTRKRNYILRIPFSLKTSNSRKLSSRNRLKLVNIRVEEFHKLFAGRNPVKQKMSITATIGLPNTYKLP